MRYCFPGKEALMFRAILLLLLYGSFKAGGQEIVLENCDRLPVVPVRASGEPFLFLVDTAATTMLNVKSFAAGSTQKIAVTSWSGTVETNAREVVLGDLAIGEHH